MNKKKPFLTGLAILLSLVNLFAQNSVGVNTVTGAGNVTIPVYDFSIGQMSFPVNLVFRGNGVKVKDVEGTAGMGCDVQMGGQISRLLRGLPDDGSRDATGVTRLGWMNTANTAATAINSFNIMNTGSGNCTNETSDVSYINNNFPITMDTEPDLFYVSAPGLYCELVYDNVSKQFKPVSYQDLKISYTYSSNASATLNSGITSFTITNDKGITYVFATPEIANMYTKGSSPSYLSVKYQQYQNYIDYFDSWYLSSMTDANGNQILLTYQAGSARNSDDPVSLYLNAATKPTFQYHVYQTVIPELLKNVAVLVDQDVITTRLSFNWTYTMYSAGGTSQSYISSITGFGKTVNFEYSDVPYSKSDGTEYHRQFLRNLTDGGNPSSPVNYSFTYYNESPYNIGFSTTLPDSSSTQVDYWGYYAAGSNTSILPKVWVNPSNGAYQRYQIYQSSRGGSNYTYTVGGNSMNVDPANVMAGSLQTITYAQGGTTTLTYEPNDYLDPQSGVVEQGNGIRVKQLTNFDGISTANNQVINYSYLAPNGLSSGKPISLPVFAFTVPYSGTNTGQNLWNSATALSTTDLSQEDHTIMYSYVKKSQTGAGVTQYQYYIPATNWDASAIPGCSGCATAEWAPVINLAARTNCSLTYGPVKNDIYTYPFIPNINYDFERGLLQKVTNYLDNGTTEVSEDNYTYQRSYAPSVINAFRWDDNGAPTVLSEKAYNKYNVYYNTSELITTDSKKVFDSKNYTQAQTSSVSYVYGSPNHRLPTQTSVTNSDNSIYTTNIAYTKDYTAIGAGTNANVNALYNLQTLNVNIPIETYQTVTRASATKLIGGSLTLFNSFNGSGTPIMNLPSQKLGFVEPDGIPVTSFTPYVATGSGGSQSSVYDTRYYYPEVNYSAYDYSGIPLTADDGNHHVITTITNSINFKPVAVFKNAANTEVVFTDFDSQTYGPENQFAISGAGTLATTGGHAGNAWNLAANNAMTAQVTRNAATQNYIFSAWINAPAGTQSLSISVNGATATTYTYTGTGQAAYYEWKLAAGSGASFSISVSSPQAIIVDDLLLYPENSEATTASYDGVSFYKTTETNTNGISNYYTNDQWGRVLFAYDQDKNIIAKNSYFTPASYRTFTPTFSYSPTTVISGTPVTFSGTGYDSSTSDTYSWNFGDGTTFNGGTSNTATHTYTTTGSENVQLTIVSPYVGAETTTQAVTVSSPAPCKVNYTNNTVGGSISSVSFTNSSGVVTTFTNTQMQAGTASIPPGTYSYTLYVSGALYTANNGKGYSSVNITYGGNSSCRSYTGSNFSGTLTVSSGWTLNFLMQTATCPPATEE